MSKISLDATHAAELVEFWSQKYKDTKDELEKLKFLGTQSEKDSRLQNAKLQEIIALLQDESKKRQVADAELRDLITRSGIAQEALHRRTVQLESDNIELSRKLHVCDIERIILAQKVQTINMQAAALAGEVQSGVRMEKVAQLFETPASLDPEFESAALRFSYPRSIIEALPAVAFPSPATKCLPLRVPSAGRSGYWFWPLWSLREDSVFQLVVEYRPDEWTYLGEYTTALLPGYDMKLSEWTTLDEMRSALDQRHALLPRDKAHPFTAAAPASVSEVEVKRRYEAGEWSVPCFSLRCLGFDKQLYDALQTAAKT
ncbi:hypothetical protein A0H81_04883 [Grifola frondosa]|uniref:DUF6697 domain-containing protein n=1 Tax=Grifola frondosa TaxID=5627 RepID=A0A1C7MFB7_GRIFR|nr:hypothetical protein A0H81_04883 [Grifola frondosa]